MLGPDRGKCGSSWNENGYGMETVAICFVIRKVMSDVWRTAHLAYRVWLAMERKIFTEWKTVPIVVLREV